jgi:hypothetical protein
MKTMGMRELKNRLSEVVRAVKAGERGLARLAEGGIVRWGAPNGPTLKVEQPTTVGGVSL